MNPPVNILLFGGCLTQQPLHLRWQDIGDLTLNALGPMKRVQSIGQMFQIIEILRGEKDIPQHIRPFCHISDRLGPVPAAKSFEGVDVALVEPSTIHEIKFRGIELYQTSIQRHILRPIRDMGKEQSRIVDSWFNQGLKGRNEAIRSDRSAALLDLLSGRPEFDDLVRDIVREAHAAPPTDIPAGLRRLKSEIDRPIGVVLYTFSYMPDGRIVEWPDGFRETVRSAAQQMDLPVFDPSPIVLRYGHEAAINRADAGHYSADFKPVIGKALADFARSVARRAPADKLETSTR